MEKGRLYLCPGPFDLWLPTAKLNRSLQGLTTQHHISFHHTYISPQHQSQPDDTLQGLPGGNALSPLQLHLTMETSISGPEDRSWNVVEFTVYGVGNTFVNLREKRWKEHFRKRRLAGACGIDGRDESQCQRPAGRGLRWSSSNVMREHHGTVSPAPLGISTSPSRFFLTMSIYHLYCYLPNIFI